MASVITQKNKPLSLALTITAKRKTGNYLSTLYLRTTHTDPEKNRMCALPVNGVVFGAFSLFPKTEIAHDTTKVEVAILPPTYSNTNEIVWHCLWGKPTHLPRKTRGQAPSRDVAKPRNRNKRQTYEKN